MELSIQERLKDLRVERGRPPSSLRRKQISPSLRWAAMKQRILRTSVTMLLSSWRSFTV